jgi:RecB family endonuclease NucS
MDSSRGRDPEVSFAIDLTRREVARLPDVRLSEIGIRERRDLQRWIEDHPEMVGRDLLVVTTEFDQWESRDARVADRLDVLFLDSVGSLLVAELKRDEAGANDGPAGTQVRGLLLAAAS